MGAGYAYANGNPINFADPTGYGASRVLDAMQGGLTALGFAPGVGAVADLVNAGISAGRGDFVGAGFNLASSLPGLGDAFAAGKIATAAVGVAVAKSASHAVSSTAATAAKVEAAVVKEGAKTLPEVRFSAGRYPELAENISHAQRAGHPSVLTHAGNSAANRAASLDGVPNIRPLSRDEYPFASSLEGGAGSWIGHVPVSQQNAQGAILKNFFKQNNIQPGDQYRVIVDP